VLRDSVDPTHLKIITLPEAMSWPFGRDVGQTLFVRPSQQHLLDRVLWRYENIRQKSGPIRDVNGCIIKGTPGIGKLSTVHHYLSDSPL